MSVNLTTALQNLGGRNPNFVELDGSGNPIASRQTGLVLLDSASVSWTSPGPVYNTLQATATVSGLPVATQAGQVPTSTGAGTTYTAQTPVAPGMVLIQKQALVAPAATVTFSAIPQTYTNLLLVSSGTNDTGATQNLSIEFNGDTTQADYSYSYAITNNGTLVGGFSYSAAGVLTGISTNSGGSNSRATITNYSSTTVNKVVESTFMCININPNTSAISGTAGGVWNSNAAITSIVAALASGNFAAGTVFSLYGLA
jgi:hypothetical protein